MNKENLIYLIVGFLAKAAIDQLELIAKQNASQLRRTPPQQMSTLAQLAAQQDYVVPTPATGKKWAIRFWNYLPLLCYVAVIAVLLCIVCRSGGTP